jgi:hypothetical protein
MPLSGVDTCYSSCCDKDSAFIFYDRPAWRQPSLGMEWVLTTANAARTNTLTCHPKHGRTRDNILVITMTDQRWLISAHAEAHWPRSYRTPQFIIIHYEGSICLVSCTASGLCNGLQTATRNERQIGAFSVRTPAMNTDGLERRMNGKLLKCKYRV